MSDSKSAIYGADAIGGVVNIVLRKNIPEPRLDIDYGAADGGAVERHAAFSASGTRGRARGSIVLDYFDRSPLLGRERDRWNNQDFTRFGGMDWRSPTASPGNVSSTTLENLPGLSSSFAAIPAASSGATLTPADFVSTAGQRNLESLLRYHGVTDAGTRKGAVAQGEYELTPQVSALWRASVRRSRVLATQFEPPALSSALVSGANPYNPFGDGRAGRRAPDRSGPAEPSRVERKWFAQRAGMRGRIREWDWEASLQKSQDDAVTVRSRMSWIKRALPRRSRRRILDDALNPFGGSGANSPALLASLLARAVAESLPHGGNSIGRVRSRSIGFAAGGRSGTHSRRQNGARSECDTTSRRRRTSPARTNAPLLLAFGELRLPLLSEAAQVPGGA